MIYAELAISPVKKLTKADGQTDIWSNLRINEMMLYNQLCLEFMSSAHHIHTRHPPTCQMLVLITEQSEGR